MASVTAPTTWSVQPHAEARTWGRRPLPTFLVPETLLHCHLEPTWQTHKQKALCSQLLHGFPFPFKLGLSWGTASHQTLSLPLCVTGMDAVSSPHPLLLIPRRPNHVPPWHSKTRPVLTDGPSGTLAFNPWPSSLQCLCVLLSRSLSHPCCTLENTNKDHLLTKYNFRYPILTCLTSLHTPASPLPTVLWPQGPTTFSWTNLQCPNSYIQNL